jgi:uncharacterized protein (TIGR00369 family)
MTDSPETDSNARVRDIFRRQRVMETFGATLTAVSSEGIEIRMPYREDLTQQHGFLHAGIVSTILDSACGLAALAHMHANANVLAVEYKINFVSPAKGDAFVARGRVVKAGRTLSVCSGDVFSVTNGEEKLAATMQSTMMTVIDNDNKD